MAKKKTAKRAPRAEKERRLKRRPVKSLSKRQMTDDRPVIIPDSPSISHGQTFMATLIQNGINNDILEDVCVITEDPLDVTIPDTWQGGVLPRVMRIGTEEGCVVEYKRSASAEDREKLYGSGTLRITIRPSGSLRSQCHEYTVTLVPNN